MLKTRGESIPQVFKVEDYVLIHILESDIYFVAVIVYEVAPVIIIDVLKRLSNVIKQYIGSLLCPSLKQNVPLIYCIIEEMFSNGYPLPFDDNVIFQLVEKESLLDKIGNKIAEQIDASLKIKRIKNVYPWRKADIHYEKNEFFIDFLHTLNFVFEAKIGILSSSVNTKAVCKSKMSGVPKFTLEFSSDSGMGLGDASFHECVNLPLWKSNHVVQFVPPDGTFELFEITKNYKSLTIPLSVNTKFETKDGGCFEVFLSSNISHSVFEETIIKIYMPSEVTFCTLVASHGKYIFSKADSVVIWIVGMVHENQSVPYSLVGKIMSSEKKFTANVTVQASFKVMAYNMMESNISNVTITQEDYECYRGLKHILLSGVCEYRF